MPRNPCILFTGSEKLSARCVILWFLRHPWAAGDNFLSLDMRLIVTETPPKGLFKFAVKALALPVAPVEI